MAYPPFSQRPRSTSAQRLEQKGLSRASAGLPQTGQSAMARTLEQRYSQRQRQAHHIGPGSGDLLDQHLRPALDGIAARLAYALAAFDIARDVRIAEPEH